MWWLLAVDARPSASVSSSLSQQVERTAAVETPASCTDLALSQAILLRLAYCQAPASGRHATRSPTDACSSVRLATPRRWVPTRDGEHGKRAGTSG